MVGIRKIGVKEYTWKHAPQPAPFLYNEETPAAINPLLKFKAKDPYPHAPAASNQ